MKARKILLIEPPFYRLIKSTYALCRYPLSLGYLASAIEKSTDWEVLAYNSDFSPTADFFNVRHLVGEGFLEYRRNLQNPSHPVWQEIRECIVEYDPAVVGLSAKSSTFASAGIVAAITRQIDPAICVVVGGPHPSSVGAQLLSCADLDIGITGEGEETLPDLLRTFGSGSDLAQVQGLVYRKNGYAVSTPKRPPIDDLDSLDFPALLAPRVLKDYHRYPKEAFRSVLATRGCPNNCFFCGSRNVWGRTVRFRSPGNVAEEIRSLQGMGIGPVHFEDDTFGAYPAYLRALCRGLTERCPGLEWSCETHVKLITDENVAIMKEAGCTMIQLGIESGNNRILREIRKGYTIEEAFRACEIIRRHGIVLETFFMVGFPRETEETLRDTLKAIERVECRKVIYSIFTPYPGTEAFEWCRAKGLICNGYDPSLHHHQSPANNFCAALPHTVFRSIATELEQAVDDKNRLARGEKRKGAMDDGPNDQAHPRLHT